MNQNLMQRYGDHGLIPNIWPYSSFVCCDSRPDLRQNAGKGSKTPNGLPQIHGIKDLKKAELLAGIKINMYLCPV